MDFLAGHAENQPARLAVAEPGRESTRKLLERELREPYWAGRERRI